MANYMDLDVRPILRAGGEPFSVIMAAIGRLEEGQGLRLYAPFKPVPLFAVMAEKGFGHSDRALDDGEWEVLFTPAAKPEKVSAASGDFDFGAWPAPGFQLDNSDLEPPEPMVRILAAANSARARRSLPFCDASRSFCFRSSRSAASAGSADLLRTAAPTNSR